MRTLALVAPTLLLAACGSKPSRPVPAVVSAHEDAPPPKEAPLSKRVDTQVEMVNVHIRLDQDLILNIRQLHGRFIPTKQGQPPTFDDKQSYEVAVDSAVVGVSFASMTHAMNIYIFGGKDAPMKDIVLSAENGEIKQKGTLRKGPGIPFEMVGRLSATPEGKIRIHPTKLKAEHLPVKGLMKLFGLDLAKLINTDKTRGVTVDDNDIILDPSQAFPPPHMRGKITSVRIEGDEIVQTFGNPVPGRVKPGANYIAYKGGVVRFGKLTMTDADMQLIDADPKDPFDFFPDRYKDQLTAGYSKTTASGGLLVYMPDFTKIKRSH